MNATLYTKNPNGGLQAVTVPRSLSDEVAALKREMAGLKKAMRAALERLEDAPASNEVLDARVCLRGALQK